ncbi:cation diffusion facilitator family transporter [Alkalitalea saponilacus]|uniref:Cobalt-zinc-cadmium efflux system protein n=1 Tax=Alkalitalea saponilacus TaxID=889453 RepID=A0A1T5G560_9BACT|nr:cation diffusion facilitator family transporter [Alkalitalea saponilacus]ASB47856.1 cation transporter [Alkalitalea saponilacus]SKC03566.1 cobalt-zinc-cadmium efflux system protein [Alkalitalea saponilacus]
MGHYHHTKEKKDPGVRKRLKVAFVLNFSFTIIEFIGGVYTNSMAIISDAIHDLGDTVAIGSALWLEKVATKKRDSKYTYGYKRFSTLGALLTSLILLVGSVIIIYEAIPRLIAPQPVLAMGMMWLAVLGIVFNGIAVLRLRGGNASLNNRAVMLHLMEDVFGWFAILIGSIIIKLTGWYWIDPILSLVVAAYILFNVFKNLRSILRVFLQSVPDNFDASKLESELLAINGVTEVHDIHTWTMDGNYHVLSLHLVVEHHSTIEQLIQIRSIANAKVKDFGIHHPTIALEFENEKCDICE